MTEGTHHKDGAALAAVFSAGLGCAVIGLLTVLATASVAVKDALNWWSPAGPLSGKTGVGVIIWLVSWLILHKLWHTKELPFRGIWITALAMIALGWIGTFPPVFEAFSGH